MKNVIKAGKRRGEKAMNTLKQKAKNNRVTFTVVTILLLLFVSLQGQLRQSYAADKTKAPQKETAYPATPEGVVRAYVNEDIRGCGHGPITPSVDVLLQYVSGDLGPGCFDNVEVVSSYKITDVKQNTKSAKVTVKYNIIGNFSYDLGDDSGYGFTPKKEKVETVVFELIKDNFGKWKIESGGLMGEYISVNASIIIMREYISREKSSKKIREGRKEINLLKKYLHEQGGKNK